MQVYPKALTVRRLGRVLRAARKFHDFTLKEVAALAGIKVSRLHHWEQGTAAPSLLHLQVLCYVLRLDPAFLFNPTKERYIDSIHVFVAVAPEDECLKVTLRKRGIPIKRPARRRDDFFEACGLPVDEPK